MVPLRTLFGNSTLQPANMRFRPSTQPFWKQGRDIQILGYVLILAGIIDFFWIASYPDYSLKVFGTTFGGLTGEAIKYQHPVIHWILGYGFVIKRRWALLGYLAYLALGCLSELTTMFIEGFHPTRATMILITLIFSAYVFFRRSVFSHQLSPPAAFQTAT